MTKTFCPLPWIHLATRPNGDVRVCCTANASGAGVTDDKEAGLVKQDGINMNLREHTIEEVWNSEHMRNTRLQMLNGIVPESCRKCFAEESAGIVSKRQWETEVWKERLDVDSIVAETDADGYLPVNIPYFDLRLGNMCNLKCTMCSPHDSSSWIKDWKLIYPKIKNKDLKTDQVWDSSFDYTWYKKSSFLNSVKEQTSNIKELYFAGGEPLMIPEHSHILNALVESKDAKNIILRYNSNGMYIDQKMLDVWSNFKQVKYNFSIDAIGERNDYIRYPSKWNDIENKLRFITENKTDNIFVNVACAVQVLNVHHLVDMAEYLIDKDYNINVETPIMGTHLVYFPSYMNVRVLPHEKKLIVKERIEQFIDKITDEKFVNHPYGKQRWQGLINYMMAEDWSHKMPMLTEYLELLDKQRGTDFRKTFPEL
jgi:MoaA/NifB/PqqE/SkfB family radical SAM enzyme